MEEEIQRHSKVIVKINGNFWNELSFKPVKLQIVLWKVPWKKIDINSSV